MFVKDSFFFGLQLEADVGPSAGSSQTSSEELSETTATPLPKSFELFLCVTSNSYDLIMYTLIDSLMTHFGKTKDIFRFNPF